LTIEHKVFVSASKSHFENKADTIEETVFGDMDIAVGGLTVTISYRAPTAHCHIL
jgi:hypothetical protein